MIAEWWLTYMTNLVESIPIPDWSTDISVTYFNQAGFKLGTVGCWFDIPVLIACIGSVALYGVIFLTLKSITWVASLVRG